MGGGGASVPMELAAGASAKAPSVDFRATRAQTTFYSGRLMNISARETSNCIYKLLCNPLPA